MDLIEYKGHLIPIDLYYFILGVSAKTKYYINNNLGEYTPFGFKELEKISQKQLEDIIKYCVDICKDNIIFEKDITLENLEKIKY